VPAHGEQATLVEAPVRDEVVDDAGGGPAQLARRQRRHAGERPDPERRRGGEPVDQAAALDQR
jgi:hypothetical protein